jgi:peroxiredoxin
VSFELWMLAVPWALMAGGCGIAYVLLRQGSHVIERLDLLADELEIVQDDLASSNSGSLQALPAGAEAPAFELPDLHGRRVSLEQFRGRRVVVVFFSPTCPICQEMAPDLGRLSPDSGDRPVPLIVTTGEMEANRAIVSEHGIRCPVLLDEVGSVSALYRPEGTPAAYLIDEVGLIAKDRADGPPAVLELATWYVAPAKEQTSAGAQAPTGATSSEGKETSKREVHVPIRGIPHDGIGVGDLVKRMTDAMGIKACRGCERRRQVLNRWVIRGSRGAAKGSDQTLRGRD